MRESILIGQRRMIVPATGDNIMRITESQLRQIIRQERARLNESYMSEGTGSTLIDFAQAYASLGRAVSDQVDKVVSAHINSNGDVNDEAFLDAVYSVNPNAIDMALEKLGSILRRGYLGDEGDYILEALDAAAREQQRVPGG
jgi:hypothetical protein